MSAAPSDPIAPAPSAAPGAPQWEFEPQHEAQMADLGRKMRFVGFFLMLVGGLGLGLMILLSVKLQTLVLDPSSLVLLFLGYSTLGAGHEFFQVAATQGRDISHLMRALGTLRSMYGLLYWLLVLSLILSLLLLAVRTAAAL